MASKQAIQRGDAHRAAFLAALDGFEQDAIGPTLQMIADSIGVSRTYAWLLATELTAKGQLVKQPYTHRTMRLARKPSSTT
jgi:hypothetical protein